MQGPVDAQAVEAGGVLQGCNGPSALQALRPALQSHHQELARAHGDIERNDRRTTNLEEELVLGVLPQFLVQQRVGDDDGGVVVAVALVANDRHGLACTVVAVVVVVDEQLAREEGRQLYSFLRDGVAEEPPARPWAHI